MELKPTSIIQARLGIEPNGKIQKKFTHNCRIHMDKYVPYADGDLRTNVNELPDRIIYMSPYAHYQYIGKLYIDPQYGVGAFPIKDKDGNLQGFYSRKNVTKIASNKDLVYHEPGTGNYWDRRMVSAEIGQVIKETTR